ncbi:MAG: hypothetical protein GX593_14355 [Actinomycetales bacterium]|nr:hypothetical protein [Actinomycetales bacterium]
MSKKPLSRRDLRSKSRRRQDERRARARAERERREAERQAAARSTGPMGPPPGRARKETPPRVRRRRLLFWLSLVPAIFVLSYGIHFARLNATFARAEAHYAAGEYWDAYETFSEMQSPNIAEPWKAHFNTGTAAYREDLLFLAEVNLDKSLRLVPEEHRCDVQTNRSLVLEAQGDALVASAEAEYEWAVAQREAEIARLLGEPYDATLFELDYLDVEISSYDRFDRAARDQYLAAEYFAYAAEAINDPACQTPPPPEASQSEQEQAEQEQQQREQEQERLEEQAQEANEDRQEIEKEAASDPFEPEPEPGEQPEPGETEEERAAREEAERQEQLEQRNEDAEEQAEGDGDGEGEGDGEDGDGDGGGGPPVSNW